MESSLSDAAILRLGRGPDSQIWEYFFAQDGGLVNCGVTFLMGFVK